jgi:hypothetical protein
MVYFTSPFEKGTTRFVSIMPRNRRYGSLQTQQQKQQQQQSQKIIKSQTKKNKQYQSFAIEPNAASLHCRQ